MKGLRFILFLAVYGCVQLMNAQVKLDKIEINGWYIGTMDEVLEKISKEKGVNLDATANLAGHDILVFWGSTSTFGTPNPDSTYTVGNNVTGGGKVYYKGPAASLPDLTSFCL